MPGIVQPDGIRLNQILASSLSGLIMLLAGGALGFMIRRRSVLDLWLMVVCCAWLLEIQPPPSLSALDTNLAGMPAAALVSPRHLLSCSCCFPRRSYFMQASHDRS